MANYSSDLSSFMPDHELVELLWDNGQVVMQGQSNRTKKSSLGTEFAFNGRLEEKGCEDDATMLKFGQTGAINLPPTVPCAMNGQEDYTAPWMNYDDSLQNDFFSELTGVHMPSLSDTNSNLNPADKSTGFGQATKDSNIFRSNPGGSEPSRSRFNHLLNMPQQCQFLSENAKSRVLDVGISNGKSNHLGHCGDLNSTRFQKEDKYAQKHLQQSSSVGLMNFSHFSRPAALVKANLHRIDRLSNHEKSCTDASTYPVDSTLVESSNGLKSPNGIHRSMEAPTQPKVLNRSSSSPDYSSFAASMAVETNEAERGAEAAVATSSVCSGYSAGATSNDPKHKSKKRSCEGEESGEQSDELEDDSFAVKKTSSGRGTNGKRSRAAEVHNMSERRRRDRINEKMRALQDLIPNCNKVDKASMLDEAIEYLKTLQLQVQMMSMGSGLCMPPMMLPAGMNFQHMRAPPITHFSPMGVGMGIGMGMGLGFGMGMIDLNGSPGLIPVSPIHGTQFPCPSVPGVSGLHWRPPSSSIQSLGIPGPRLPAAVPHAPLFSSQAGLSPQGILMNPLQVSDAPPSSSNNQQQQCINLDAIENASNKKANGQASQTVCPLMHKNI